MSNMFKVNTAKNAVFLPNFLVWTFCRKAQFRNSFGQIAWNCAETVPFHKISVPGNEMKLQYFSQCNNKGTRALSLTSFYFFFFFFLLTLNIFPPFSSACNVDFEQENVCWVFLNHTIHQPAEFLADTSSKFALKALHYYIENCSSYVNNSL